MNSRIGALEQWKIAEDAARAAVKEYREGEEKSRINSLKHREAKAWMDILKQVGIILGIVTAILYAYASTRGINP